MGDKEGKAEGANGMNSLLIYFWVTFVVKKEYSSYKKNATVLGGA